ncbi:Sulfite exporter TauE/SafE [Pseudovibrio axinellae]|uniref:Probable membrane transporter protein n=1 Tax=Pseudovibrio axinellae TaxID=989403 RepID=A0A161V7B6_9HYPH|nr:sulfite exporter TauE/SafE family protein [Pseudovibrio axinellae]KZL20801.1 Sulfite exporter TauE/SafE [Pseudovibrio axinellae]SER22143.1 hypothetical protein SAMN05421798_10786 [Pseudovibrio axinellae]
MQDIITNPLFYLVAIPALAIVGISKGGFGGGVAILGVPMLSLIISPVQAAAILLPLLVAMDIVGLVAYRNSYDATVLKLTIPAGILGITIGWATAVYLSEAVIRLIIGGIALAFVMKYWIGDKVEQDAPKPSRAKGFLWGTVAGFTSFISHAGGPPYQIYALPLKLPTLVFAGTTVVFFAIINALKLIPYTMLGAFDTQNLTASAVLLPFAPLSMFMGVKIAKVINQQIFYKVTYFGVFIVSIKLISDGLVTLF